MFHNDWLTCPGPMPLCHTYKCVAKFKSYSDTLHLTGSLKVTESSAIIWLPIHSISVEFDSRLSPVFFKKLMRDGVFHIHWLTFLGPMPLCQTFKKCAAKFKSC